MKFFLLTMFAATITFSATTNAENCGVPKGFVLGTETVGHCDIYQRQLAYREESLEMKRIMEERQENFAEPRREAIKQYEADLEALNEKRSSTQD